MADGDYLRGAARRARARLREARRRRPGGAYVYSAARRAQARRTAMYWNGRLRAYRAAIRAARAFSWLYGGSDGVCREIEAIVRDLAPEVPVTSAKRAWGTWGSDHHISQTSASARDFGIGNAYWLASRIAQRLGGSWSGDYDSFIITRHGKRFRVQLIAGTHGTGPHLHAGVRRV